MVQNRADTVSYGTASIDGLKALWTGDAVYTGCSQNSRSHA